MSEADNMVVPLSVGYHFEHHTHVSDNLQCLTITEMLHERIALQWSVYIPLDESIRPNLYTMIDCLTRARIFLSNDASGPFKQLLDEAVQADNVEHTIEMEHFTEDDILECEPFMDRLFGELEYHLRATHQLPGTL